MSTTTFTGTFIDDLMARADNILAIHGTRQSSVDSPKRWSILSAVFRRLNDWQQIVAIQNHLADTMIVDQYVSDDYQDRLSLYYDLGEIQVAIGMGLRDVCRKCGCMEGLHLYKSQICPVQPGIEAGPQLVSNTFTR